MAFIAYQSEIDRILKAPGGPVGRHTNFVARAVAAEASKEAVSQGLVRTGRYARSFKTAVTIDPENGFYFTVSNSVVGQNPRRKSSYASVIEHGSTGHPITPRRKDKWLVFTMPDGKIVKTKLVKHPGTPPRNVLRNALARVSAFL